MENAGGEHLSCQTVPAKDLRVGTPTLRRLEWPGIEWETAARVQQQVAKGQAGHFKDFSFLLSAMGRHCSSVTQLTYASTGSLWLPNWKTKRCGGGVRERLLADKGAKQGGQLT